MRNFRIDKTPTPRAAPCRLWTAGRLIFSMFSGCNPLGCRCAAFPASEPVSGPAATRRAVPVGRINGWCSVGSAAGLRVPVLSLLLALVLLVGCSKEEALAPVARRPLVVYLAVDNDLQGELSTRLTALKRGWRPGMELWVYADTPEGASLGRMESTPEGASLRTVEEYGEENSASGSTLERVLRTVWRLCPRDGYGLLFFSHATGWLPEGTLQRPADLRSVGHDHGSEIALEAFAAALPKEMPLDYVVFETCLMAGAEVALELAGRTEWMLASSAEMLRPGFVPLYGDGLELLASRERPVEELLTAFGQRYLNHVRGLSGVDCSATLSVVRTSSLPALAEAVRRVRAGAPDAPADGALPEGLQRFDRPGMYGDRPAAARFFDMEEWAERTCTDPGALEGLRAALADAVVWKDATERFMGGEGTYYNGFEVRRHSGLTVYIPREEFPALNESYRRTGWWRATREGL